MAFGINMPAAARRHLHAADILANERRPDVAGYLYGIAAECAIKAMMSDAGIPIPADSSRRDHPYYAHFPELRTMLRDVLKGRRGKPLNNFVQNDAFMHQWSTTMRYSDGRKIRPKWVSTWAAQARQAVASIET